MIDIDYVKLPVTLYRMGVPESDPIHEELSRLHEADDKTWLSPDEQGSLIGNACLRVDREYQRVCREYPQ